MPGPIVRLVIILFHFLSLSNINHANSHILILISYTGVVIVQFAELYFVVR